MKKTLVIEDNQVRLYNNDKLVRYTNLGFLPQIPDGITEGKELAEWGMSQQDHIDRFAILPFYLFLSENKVELFHSHNGEYKVVTNGFIKGFNSCEKLRALDYLNSILEQNGKNKIESIENNDRYEPGNRGTSSLILSIDLD